MTLVSLLPASPSIAPTLFPPSHIGTLPLLRKLHTLRVIGTVEIRVVE